MQRPPAGTTGSSPTITGHGEISGGRYQTITITGQGRISGDVEADRIVVQGAATLAGATSAEEITAGGEVHFAGPVQAQRVRLEGSARIEGDLRSDQVMLAGAHAITGDLIATVIEIRGQLTEANRLEARQISIELAGDSEVRSLRGGTVEVRPGRSGGHTRITLRRGRAVTTVKTSGELPGRRSRRLKADTIEGQDISLEQTTARRVSGARVSIGAGCDIGTLEYSETLQVAPDARVGTTTRTRPNRNQGSSGSAGSC